MPERPGQFLLNLAILKVNWDTNRDLLHNFMPLVGYAIKQLPNDVVSINELKSKIEEVAQFKIPTGALEMLVRRASRPQYGYVRPEGRLFRRNPKALDGLDFENNRRRASERFGFLLESFQAFSREHFGDDAPAEAAVGFYEVIYQAAPRLVGSSVEYVRAMEHTTASDQISMQYKVARFVADALQNKPVEAEIIEEFFQGAALAESFYYTAPDAIRQKLRDVSVYYDTALLSRVLGYSDLAQVEGASELHKILLDTRAKTCVFEHTVRELNGIFTAASISRRRGPLKAQRPGDIFDWLTRKGYSSSDIELELARIPDRLSELKIDIRETLAHTLELGIDEGLLRQAFSEEMNYRHETAINVDIDSVSAIYRLRAGRPQNFLESCKAIFVTSNAAMAQASTKYFNQEFGVSNAPICIGDRVFCMLMWLKTAEKKPEIPREMLVANCLATLTPSKDLWERYIAETERLRARGDISDTDYILLAQSIEARQALMDTTAGDADAFLAGSVTDVLEAAKNAITAEALETLRQKDEEVFLAKREATFAVTQLQAVEARAARIIETIISIATLLLVLIVGFAVQGDYVGYIQSGAILSHVISLKTLFAALWFVMLLLGAFSLVLGWAALPVLRKASQRIARAIVGA